MAPGLSDVGEDGGDRRVVERAALERRLQFFGVHACGYGVEGIGGRCLGSIGAIVDAIVDRKIDFERIVGIPQGWRMVGAVKTAERWLADGKLQHGGQPLMAWSIGNAKPEARGNAVVITKQQAGTAKIDPLMALFNAGTLMSLNPKPRRKQYQLLFA